MEKRVKRGEQKVTVALKPAIVLPVGQPANQAAQSGRDSENQREEERERERRLPWLLGGRCERTCLSVGCGSVQGGPSRRADVCASACLSELGC